MTDAELVRSASRGDSAAFEALLRRYARLVWATIAGMLRDPSWTEDLVQETFLKAWKAIATLEDPGAFRPWLLSIARRLVFRHTEVHGRAIEPRGGSADDTYESDSDVARDRVQSALQRLPERYRLPISLRFLNEMEYGDISRELQLSNGALRGLVHRGVKMLREELRPFWKSQTEEP